MSDVTSELDWELAVLLNKVSQYYYNTKANLKDTVRDLQQQVEEVNKHLDAQATKVSELENQLEGLRDENRKLEIDYSTLENDFGTLSLEKHTSETLHLTEKTIFETEKMLHTLEKKELKDDMCRVIDLLIETTRTAHVQEYAHNFLSSGIDNCNFDPGHHQRRLSQAQRAVTDESVMMEVDSKLKSVGVVKPPQFAAGPSSA